MNTSNMSEHTPCPPLVPYTIDECTFYELIIYTAIMGPICLLGLGGNILLCCIFHNNANSLMTSSRILLISMAVTDGVFLLAMIPTFCIQPLLAYTGSMDFYTHYIYPYIYLYMFIVCSISHTCSVWVTVVVGVSRYVAICKPFSMSTYFSETRTILCIMAVITAGFLYNLPQFLECKITFQVIDNETVPQISDLLHFNSTWKTLYDTIFYLWFIFVIPLFILLVICVLGIRKLQMEKQSRRCSRTFESSRQNLKNQTKDHMEKCVTKMLLVVLIVFIFCQAPAMINRAAMIILPYTFWECGTVAYYLGHLCNVLLAVNSSINIFIYIKFNKTFRTLLRITCDWRKSLTVV